MTNDRWQHAVLPQEAQQILRRAAEQDRISRIGLPEKKCHLFIYHANVAEAVQRVKDQWPELFRW